MKRLSVIFIFLFYVTNASSGYMWRYSTYEYGDTPQQAVQNYLDAITTSRVFGQCTKVTDTYYSCTTEVPGYEGTYTQHLDVYSGCPTGTVYFNPPGQCLSPTCQDLSSRSELTGICPEDCPQGQETFISGIGASCPQSTCYGTRCCEMQRSSDVCTLIQMDETWHWASNYKYTGYACASCNTGDPEPYEPFECPNGQVKKSCPGSSVTYCMLPEVPLDCSSGDPPVPLDEGSDTTPGQSEPGEGQSSSDPTQKQSTTSTSSDSTSVDNGDGTTTVTTTTTTIINNGDGSTSTQTTISSETKDNTTGEVIGSSLETTTTEEGDGGDSVAGNNQCDQPPTCKGNAVDCANLFNTWKQKCLALQDSSSEYCKKNPSSVICQQPDELTNDVLGEDQELDISITPESLPMSNSCPGILTTSISSRSISLDLTPFCNMASAIKPIVIILAWLAAAFLLFKD